MAGRCKYTLVNLVQNLLQTVFLILHSRDKKEEKRKKPKVGEYDYTLELELKSDPSHLAK